MGHTVIVVWYVSSELVPTSEEASQFCEVCGSRCVDYAFNLGCCWSISFRASQVDPGIFYFSAELDLVSCKFDVLESASCQHLSQDVQCFRHFFCFDEKVVHFDVDSCDSFHEFLYLPVKIV